MKKTTLLAGLICTAAIISGAGMSGAENGSLVYSIEIAQPDHSTMDVKIDVGNDKILKTEKDQNDHEEREKENSGNDNEERG